VGIPTLKIKMFGRFLAIEPRWPFFAKIKASAHSQHPPGPTHPKTDMKKYFFH
jgi:hypothetical protein